MELAKELRKTHVQLFVLFGTLFLYLISLKFFPGRGHAVPTILGLFVFVEMIGFVFWEIKDGVHRHGWKHEIVDTVLVLAAALLVLFIAGIVLNTSTPISGVVSCSMKPNLQRGDFVLIQGAAPLGYQINMAKKELQELRAGIATVYTNQTNISVPGSMYSHCAVNRAEPLCQQFMDNPAAFRERAGPLTYNYGMCILAYDDGTSAYGPCVRSVIFRDMEYLLNFSHDTIVYQSDSGQLFAEFGDIVHRVFFVVNAEGDTYYITRGDNNPVFDIQMYAPQLVMGNDPVPQRNFKGKVIGRIPLLGYFKLFLHWYFVEDQQCRWQLEVQHTV